MKQFILDWLEKQRQIRKAEDFRRGFLYAVEQYVFFGRTAGDIMSDVNSYGDDFDVGLIAGVEYVMGGRPNV